MCSLLPVIVCLSVSWHGVVRYHVVKSVKRDKKRDKKRDRKRDRKREKKQSGIRKWDGKGKNVKRLRCKSGIIHGISTYCCSHLIRAFPL